MSALDRERLVGRLRDAGCVFADEEAGLLVAEASSADKLENMVVQRAAGYPLEQIVGWAEFRGAHTYVNPGVFVPRRRTEFLVELAVPLLAPGRRAVDLCCGSGAVGAALAREVPGLEVYAADVDPDAVACARRNLPVERVFEGDLFDALPRELRGRVDVLAVNAPYVPTADIALMPAEARDHEHRVALDGGRDGLDVQRRVVAGATTWLAPGGHLLIETSVRQAPVTLALFSAAGLDARIALSDEYDATVVVGVAGE
jgi:release factor glutamine methyltransferase